MIDHLIDNPAFVVASLLFAGCLGYFGGKFLVFLIERQYRA